jgi:peptidoglycan hydrolase-like protein with peptidoglycan-binding domain
MQWRTYVRAFNHGLMLTGLPVLAFLAVDYLVAPPAGSGKDAARVAPAPDSGVAKFVPASSGLDRQAAAADDASEAQSIAPTAFKSLIKSAVGNVASGGRSSLVTSIQEELQRVGCFAGDVDGTWSERTKSAMQAFNASVHVSLPTDRPDYIHLTLLQGHSSKACARSCERDVCVDRSIEARAVAPASPATDGRTAQSNGEARLSSAVVPTPVVMQRSPAASTVVHVAPSQAAAGSAASRRGVDT